MLYKVWIRLLECCKILPHTEKTRWGGGHITTDIGGLNQLQKDETHMIFWHMAHRLESDQERSAKITNFSVPKQAC